MKDYLQPAAILALALAIASLPFTLPMAADATGATYIKNAYEDVLKVRVVGGCR